MNALHASGFLNSVIRGSICDPSFGDPESHPNSPFFSEVEWYLTCRQVAHAGDTFNTYCQNILAEILTADPSVWELLKKKDFRAKSRDEAVANLRIQREGDGSVRKALRVSLDVGWCGEMEIIAELRNRIVHQSGMDPEGIIDQTIRDFPPGQQFIPPAGLDENEFPVQVDSQGKLVIDAKTGYWATQHVIHHIHMLDQHLCYRFALPRRRYPTRKIGFSVRGNATALTLPPGTPLPLPKMAPVYSPPIPELSPFPSYETMPNQQEIECAKTWRKAREEIYEFVRSSCEDLRIEICGVDGSLAGSILSHTIQGHDHHLGFELQPKDTVGNRPKFLGVRLRQENFNRS